MTLVTDYALVGSVRSVWRRRATVLLENLGSFFLFTALVMLQ